MMMNKGSKMKSGWLRILRNGKKLLTTTRAAFHALAQMKISTGNHSENISSRLRIDKHAVQDLRSCISDFDCDSFDLNKPQLRTLLSDVDTSAELLRDFESAYEDGDRRVTKFFREKNVFREHSHLMLLFTDVEGILSAKHHQL